MADDMELTVKVAMESQSMQQQISNINRQMKVVQSEFANASSKLGEFGSVTDRLKIQAESFTSQIDLEKQKVALLSEAHEKARETLEKNVKASELLKQQLNETKKAYEDSVIATGKNSEESKKLEQELRQLQKEYKDNLDIINNNSRTLDNYKIKVNNAEKGVNQLQQQLRKTTEEIESEEAAIDELGNSTESTSEHFKNMGEKMSSIGKVIATGMAVGGAAIVGIATAGVQMSDDLSKALNGLQASVGYSDSQMQGMKETMIEIYSDNFGDSFEDIGEAIKTIGQQSGLAGEELKGITENAIAIKDTFGFEVNESFRSAKMMMDQFGMSGENAYNLIAQGAQWGLDKNGDLLDSINEYSVHFKQMGFTADEMFNMLANGAAGGTFSVDKLADAVKEFGIRAKDGSNSTSEAFQQLGLDADKLSADFAAGGERGKEAFNTVNKALLDMSDPLEQNQIGTALWGTMWEDLGVSGIKALNDVSGEISSTYDALKDINSIKYDNFGEAVQGIKRQLQVGIILPIGEAVLPSLNTFANFLAQNIPSIISNLKPLVIEIGNAFNSFVSYISGSLPKLESSFNTVLVIVKPIFNVLVESVKLLIDNFNSLLPVLTGVLAAILTYKAISTITTLMETWKTITEAVSTAQGILNAALLANPFAVVAAAIGGLIAVFALLYNTNETFRNNVNQTWNQVKVTIIAAVENIKTVISLFVKVAEEIWKSYGDDIVNVATIAFNLIYSVIKIALDLISNIIKVVTGVISGNWGQVWDGMSGIISTVWNGIGDIISNAIELIKSTISTGLQIAWDVVKRIFNGIKEAIMSPIRAAVDFVKDQVDRIKGFFDGLHIELPHIKLPHFALTGEFSLEKMTVPHFDVNWYDTGGIFTRPSVIGVGEKRPEFVGALEDLRYLIGSELDKRLGNNEKSSNQPIIITVISQLDGEVVAKTTAKYSDKIQGQNIMLAERGL